MTTYVTMYDALGGSAIPHAAAIGCWYPYDSRSSRPNITGRVLTIDNSGNHPDCDILDLEPGAAWPPSIVTGWLEAHYNARHTVGTVYCDVSNHGSIPTPAADYYWWAAEWTNQPFEVSGAVATQYEDAGPYDLSMASTTWLAAITGGVVPPPPPPPVDPTLQQGATGAAVDTLQTRLNVWGAKLTVDGNFGPATLAAVKAFQTAHKLTVDGVVGSSTWAALNASPVKPPPPPPPNVKPAPPNPKAAPYSGVTLSWGAGAGPPYRFQVFKGTTLVKDETVTATAAGVQPLAAGTYTWHVGTNGGAWTATQSFTVLADPPPGPAPPPVYGNPLRGMVNLVAERIDQGVDYSGTGPIYALGDGVVVSTLNAGWPGGAFICYQLTAGQYAGKYVYAAEDITPAVAVGQVVNQSTRIGTVFAGSAGIETGWAAGPPNVGESMARLNGQTSPIGDPGEVSSAYGAAFSGLLHYLGAPAGILQGPVVGIVPADYNPPA